MVLQQLRQRAPFERRPAAQHGEHHAAEAVEIAVKSDRPAVGLFRRHILCRSHQPAVRCDPRISEQPGNSEIGQLDVALAGQQQIRRLEIAMDHAVVVGVLEGPSEHDA